MEPVTKIFETTPVAKIFWDDIDEDLQVRGFFSNSNVTVNLIPAILAGLGALLCKLNPSQIVTQKVRRHFTAQSLSKSILGLSGCWTLEAFCIFVCICISIVCDDKYTFKHSCLVCLDGGWRPLVSRSSNASIWPNKPAARPGNYTQNKEEF